MNEGEADDTYIPDDTYIRLRLLHVCPGGALSKPLDFSILELRYL